jgi:mRNA interferase RelE/StbE
LANGQADWQYVVLKPAQKYLERMQTDDQTRIIEALDTLLTEPETLDVKPLKGRSELRLRIGKYRVSVDRKCFSILQKDGFSRRFAP